jgi:hypothetical protein
VSIDDRPRSPLSRLHRVVAALLVAGLATACGQAAEVTGSPVAAAGRPPAATTTTTITRTTTTTTTTAPPRGDTAAPRIVRQSPKDRLIFVRPCPPTTTVITASVTDDVGVVSATLTYTDPGGGRRSEPMTFGNGVWTASMGPFGWEGNSQWQVTATDAAGNTGKGEPTLMLVAICPG